MNVLDAAQAMVKAYPGGTESLASRLGMTGALLRTIRSRMAIISRWPRPTG